MSDLLRCVELEPRGGPAHSSVVWLHGLGADGHDFEPIVPYLNLANDLRVRFVFPHAPRIPVTVNMGMIMPAWYDIAEMDLKRRHDEAGIRRSAMQVEALLAREVERGVPSHRIVLAGFSQGGAIALHVGLRHAQRLAGLMALSCYLVLEASLATECHPANADTPVFQAHGRHDPVVPFERGERCRDRLRELGHPVRWHSYAMEHQVHPEEIAQIGEWLNEVLVDQSGAS
jgi:phospholipase/carboxylesterase